MTSRTIPTPGQTIEGPFGPDGYSILVTAVEVFPEHGNMAVTGIRSDADAVRNINPTGEVSFLWDYEEDDQEAPILAEISNWEKIEDIVARSAAPAEKDTLINTIHRELSRLHGDLYDLRANALTDAIHRDLSRIHDLRSES